MSPWRSWSLIFPSLYFTLIFPYLSCYYFTSICLGVDHSESLFPRTQHHALLTDPRLVLFQFPSLGTLVKHRLTLFCLSFYLLLCVCLLFFLCIPFSPFAFTISFFLLLLYICFVVLLYGSNCFLSFFLHEEIFGYNLHLICVYIFLMRNGFCFCFIFVSHYLGFAFPSHFPFD